MGIEIIVARKNDDLESSFFADQDSHPFLAEHIESLDETADLLKTKKLSAFIDTSELESNFYEEQHGEEIPENWAKERAKWFDPKEAIISLRLIIGHLREQRLQKINDKDVQGLIEDLSDCLKLLETLDRENDLFNFSPLV